MRTHRKPTRRGIALLSQVLVLVAALLATLSARASTRRSTPHASAGKANVAPIKAKGGKPVQATKAGKPSRPGKPAKSAAAPKPAPIPNAKGKVAVFLFDGDGTAPLRARVVRLLRARGLTVNTSLRPVDSAEQYREMADTLGLAAFLDGEASEDGDQASVTVNVRSGVSGLRIASATLSGERRKLAAEMDKSLWTQLGPPLARVCAEAAKPRKREREPMRIEAGTPLDAPPVDPKRELEEGNLKKGT